MKWPDDYVNKIIHADCMDVMSGIPDRAVDLVLTDPPYGIGTGAFVGGDNACKATDYGDFNKWDSEIPKKDVFESFINKSINQIVWGGNYFVRYLDNSPCWIVWDKDNSGNFADCELAYTSFRSAVRKIKWRWNGMIQENGGKHKEERYHPTQKPVALFEWCLNKYSNEGDLILDPFSGSGTTAIACHRLNMRFICIEKEKSYYESSLKRLKEEQAQMELF
ncbi:MAG: site-specific DNA-methyltransferase [Candidatus Auribacterota bacterium]|nr:site-specific DNA-methyltransferase [Candidatus Auribacterota bacterium]